MEGRPDSQLVWTSKIPPKLSALLSSPSVCSRLTQASNRIMYEIQNGAISAASRSPRYGPANLAV